MAARAAKTPERTVRHRARVLHSARILNGAQTLLPCAAFLSECYLAGVRGLLGGAGPGQAVLLVLQLLWPFPVLALLPWLATALYLDALAPWLFWASQALNACTIILVLLTVVPPLYEFAALYRRLRAAGETRAWELAFVNTRAGLAAFLLAAYLVTDTAVTALVHVIHHWASERRRVAERARALRAMREGDRKRHPDWQPAPAAPGAGAAAPAPGAATL